jgi:hypothetical protein
MCVLNANATMTFYNLMSDLNEISSSHSTSSVNNVKAACASQRLSPNPKRSITFSPIDTMCHNVLHINDYSDEEIACAWYNAEELKTIMNDVIETLGMMNGGKHIPEETPWYCNRGLESFTREVSSRKRANRANALYAVLDEQNLQWEDDIGGDPEAIANAYSEITRHCQDAAVMKAIQDQDISHATSFKLKGGASFVSGSSTRIVLHQQLRDCRH